jgi:uncharacterized surface protein with fasciclin (FAS1) repeats
MKKLQATLCAVALVAAGFAAVNQRPPIQEQNAVDWISTSPQHTILAGLIIDAGMTDTLKAVGPFTVFAPNDEAFHRLPEGKIEELRSDPVKLREMLEYHVVSGRYGVSDLQGMPKITTILMQKTGPATLKLKWENSTLMVNDAKVVMQDTWVSNGVVQSVDTVLMPAPSR